MVLHLESHRPKGDGGERICSRVTLHLFKWSHSATPYLKSTFFCTFIYVADVSQACIKHTTPYYYYDTRTHPILAGPHHSHRKRSRSLVVAMDEHHVESSEDPSDDGESEGKHRADPPCEGGGDRWWS